MIREAFEAKQRERGGPRKYSVRALGEEANQDHSLISKVMRGRRPATREILIALAEPLQPYFNVDAALVEAGYTPVDPHKATIVQKIAAVSGEVADDVLREVDALIDRFRRGALPSNEADGKDEGESDDNHQPRPPSPSGG